jgi:signal transduction histidine kinase
MDTTDLPRRLQLYEALCDSLQDSVFLLDSDGRIYHANQRFCEATERRVELDVTSPLEGDVVVEARITDFEASELAGAAVVLRDVTEMTETAAALAEKSEQLAVVNSVLRHDIRNDMSIMLGWGERLGNHITTDEGQDILDRVLRHGSHVVELTHAAKDLVEAIENEWSMDLYPVDVQETVTREVELVRERFPDAEVVLSDPVPAVTVQANEFLGSVISNVLTNAIRHNDADIPRVSVDADTNDETARIAITDNGPGIPDTQKEAVLGQGVRGPDSDGTGLGLYLVQSLVEAYDGTLDISDSRPRGTVITVELSRAPQPSNETRS